MPGEILCTPADLRDHASAIQQQAADAESQFTSLKVRLESLASQFRGDAAAAFEQHWNEWHQNAVTFMDALDGLGRFLTAAADTLETVDQDLAKGLQG